MAGIGFRLQKLLAGESLTDLVRAYLYSALIATGPMLVVMLTLIAIRAVVRSQLSIEDGTLYMGVMVYVYAFSMLGLGPVIYVITRWLADQYYLQQSVSFTPAYVASLLFVFIPQSIIALIFLSRTSFPPIVQWSLLALYLAVNGIWIALIFLSAARSYLWIAAAFFGGGGLGLGLAAYLGIQSGFPGFVIGYTIGQVLTFFVLSFRVFKEFGYEYSVNFGFLAYFKKYPLLCATGLFYYGATWADKFVFWFSDLGESLGQGIRVSSNYDTPMFLAFLTIIPSMAFFLLQMETTFARTYQRYYRIIQERANLNAIRSAKDDILKNLSSQFQKFLLFQGIISGIAIVALYPIAEAFLLNPYQLGIFRIGILGVFLQMAFVMALNILFYFDFQWEVFWISFIYFALNTVLTLLTLHAGLASYGFGFMAASFVAALCGFLILSHKLKNLEYWTFMTQPILIPKFKFEEEK